MNYLKNWKRMTISEIITKHYIELSGMVRNQDVVVEMGNTSEDIFQSVMVTAIKKYKDKELDEHEGFEYLKRTYLLEMHFSPKRKSRDILVFNGDNQDLLKDR